MPRFRLRVNGATVDVDVDGAMPLLWVLRDVLALTGTKFGCGVAQCGACTVHLDGEAMASCVVPVSDVGARTITTIEGLSPDRSHPVQRAWMDEDVPQCGYCQAGQIMRAAALLQANPRPTSAEIDAFMRPNLCRCGTYVRIRRAVKRAAASLAVSAAEPTARPADRLDADASADADSAAPPRASGIAPVEGGVAGDAGMAPGEVRRRSGHDG